MRTINSVQHPLVKHFVKLRHNRDYRYEHQSVIIEGIKIVAEVCSHSMPKTLIALDETLFPVGTQDADKIVVSEAVMQKISAVQNPEGIIAEIALPPDGNLNGLKWILALDGVNDPGNLGNLLRTALALGWEGVFLIGECCDPYNEKSLRAARGATFRLPIRRGNWDDLDHLVRQNGILPLVADLQGKTLEKLNNKGKGMMLVLGNEAHGPSPTAHRVCQAVTIPMTDKIESLNVSVAGGILMFALRI